MFRIDPNGHECTDIEVIISGANNVPNTPHPEIKDVSNLGPKDEPRGGYLALNTVSHFRQTDNPNDYKTLRSVWFTDGKSIIPGAQKNVSVESPSKNQTNAIGSSKYVYDSPGQTAADGQTKSSLYDKGSIQIFAISEQKRDKTKETSGLTFYKVTIGYTKDGKIVSNAIKLNLCEFMSFWVKKY
jgi:hypothetical protein